MLTNNKRTREVALAVAAAAAGLFLLEFVVLHLTVARFCAEDLLSSGRRSGQRPPAAFPGISRLSVTDVQQKGFPHEPRQLFGDRLFSSNSM